MKHIYEFRDYYLFKRSIGEACRKDDDVKNELKQVLVKFDKLEGMYYNTNIVCYVI